MEKAPATKTARSATAPKDALATYRAKRRFDVTPEPAPDAPATKSRKGGLAFVVQKHDATRLHYDVRLEIGGTMMSFAVPKGPSYDPAEKRLAVETEDHPMAYNSFEGNIPHGEYGGGDVIVWDRGTYQTIPPGEELAMRAKGRLHVRFDGEKLQGAWHFIRTRAARERAGEPTGRKSTWLFFKANDEHVDTERDPVVDAPQSVVTGNLLPRDRPAAKPTSAKRTAKAPAKRVARTTTKARARRAGA